MTRIGEADDLRVDSDFPHIYFCGMSTHALIQAAGGLGPPGFSQTPWWIGFWVTTVIILVVVAFVGSIIMVVNRVEYQAAITVMQLSETKQAASPLTALPAANAHLAAVGKAILAVVASKG